MMENKNCIQQACTNTPTFNYEGAKVPIVCEYHRVEGMLEIVASRKICKKRIKCHSERCESTALYGYHDGPVKFCAKHTEDKMIRRKRSRKKCPETGCLKEGIFNYLGEKSSKFCAQHRLSGMFDVKNKTCEHKSCTKRAYFRYEGDLASRFCGQHKLNGMKISHGKRSQRQCRGAECFKEAIFNYRGEKSGKFCAQHRLSGMIDVKNKTCEHKSCTKRAYYRYEGDLASRFCHQHKLFGMKISHGKTGSCEYLGCSKFASFNFEGERSGRLCGEHLLMGMKNVDKRQRQDLCCANGCHTVGHFFSKKDGLSLRYCARHRPAVYEHASVRRFCEMRSCQIQAYYGDLLERKRRFCSIHKLDGMVLLSHPRCKAPGCVSFAYYGFYGRKKQQYCKTHKLEGMKHFKAAD